MALSKEKIIECKEQFDLFDKDKDRCINKKELGDILRTLGENLSKDELTEIMKINGKPEASKITYKDFLEIYAIKFREHQLKEENKRQDQIVIDSTGENEYIEAFKLFDKDGNGMIPANDLKEIMVSLGEISEQEALQLVNDADLENDGYIHYYEFVDFMMRKLFKKN
jgi:calmodulin